MSFHNATGTIGLAYLGDPSKYSDPLYSGHACIGTDMEHLLLHFRRAVCGRDMPETHNNINGTKKVCTTYTHSDISCCAVVLYSLNTGFTSLLNFGRRVGYDIITLSLISFICTHTHYVQLPLAVSIITTAHEIGHNHGSPVS